MCLANSSVSKKSYFLFHLINGIILGGKYIGKERADEHGLNQVGAT